MVMMMYFLEGVRKSDWSYIFSIRSKFYNIFIVYNFIYSDKVKVARMARKNKGEKNGKSQSKEKDIGILKTR